MIDSPFAPAGADARARAQATVLRLDLPANAGLTPALAGLAARTCDRAEDLRGDAVLVLGLNGSVPAADEPRRAADTALITQWEHILHRIERLPALVVAIADGACDGVRAAALLVADYRIAGRGFRLSLADGCPETLMGMAGFRLQCQLGAAQARRILLWQMELGARKALELGLLDEICTDEKAALAMLLERHASLDPVDRSEFAVRRRLLLQDAATDFEDALGSHLAACDRSIRLRHS